MLYFLNSRSAIFSPQPKRPFTKNQFSDHITAVMPCCNPHINHPTTTGLPTLVKNISNQVISFFNTLAMKRERSSAVIFLIFFHWLPNGLRTAPKNPPLVTRDDIMSGLDMTSVHNWVCHGIPDGFSLCDTQSGGGGVVDVRIAAWHYCGNVIRKLIFGKRSFGLGTKDGGLGVEEFSVHLEANGRTSSNEIANILFPVVKPTDLFLGLVKSEPERYTPFEDTFTEDKILHFVETSKFPLVTTLTELNSAKVYSSTGKLQVYVFAEADDLKKLLDPFQDAARKFKSKLMFVFVNNKEENLAKSFLTLFGLEDSEDTIVAAFDYKINNKYLLESDPTPTKIEEFCLGLVQGTMLQFYKSQAIPDNKDADILAIVGKTFDSLVLSSPKNILLAVYTPWCFNCETTTKNVEKLAKHFKGLESLTFARIDASANEHPKLQINEFPTLLFYPVNDKSNPIKLPIKSGLKDLAKLINKNVKAQHQIPKEEL